MSEDTEQERATVHPEKEAIEILMGIMKDESQDTDLRIQAANNLLHHARSKGNVDADTVLI